MMISQTMNGRLNQQITAEFSAAHSYLAMAGMLDGMGLKAVSKRFIEQYEEEVKHALKILRYVLEVGGKVGLEGVPKPTSDFKSVEAIVQASVEHEKRVTQMINDLVTLAEQEKDYATRSFLDWFVDEQVEEVSTMTEMLNIVRLAGPNLLQVEGWVRHQMTEGKT